MEYKRLTMRNNNLIDTNCKNCKQCKKVGRKYICNDMTACDEEIINRLAELEDKIENGTLVELPCKVGQKIWYVSYIRIEEDREINILEEWDVEKIDIYDDVIICRLTHKGTDHYNTARNDEFGEKWFTDKAEAEAKLKELKGEV